METKHHIINLCEHNEVYKKIYFSIDFEPVELWLSKEIVEAIWQCDPNADFGIAKAKLSLFFWQTILDKCCETLGKEKRDVRAIRDGDKMQKFNTSVLEYIGEGSGYHWLYFVHTKTYHFNKFYEWWKVCTGGNKLYEKEEEVKYADWYFHQHYETIYKHLKQQGLAVGKSYYEPSHETIDNLTKSILNHGNT